MRRGGGAEQRREAGVGRVVPATLAAAALYTAAFAPLGWWPLAWLAPLPLALVLLDVRRPCTTAAAAGAGLVFAWAAALGLVGHWTFLAARDYFDKSSAVAAAFTLAVPWLGAGLPLCFAMAFAPLGLLRATTRWWRVAAFAASWCLADLLREHAGVGNPWLQLGHAFPADGGLAGLAGLAVVGGVPLLSFCAAAVGASLAEALRAAPAAERAGGSRAGASHACASHARARGQAIAVVLVILALQWAAGTLLLRLPLEPGPVLRVGIVQAALAPEELWNRRRIDENFRRYLELTRELGDRRPQLVLWPENAVPLLLDADLDRSAALRALAAEMDTWILVGASRVANRDGRVALSNAAYLFAPDGSAERFYDKRRLLPLVEDHAWPGFSGENAVGGFIAGEGPAVLEVGDLRVAVTLCFEALYGDAARAARRDGADVLLNLSNDAWFAVGAGRAQHVAMLPFRSLEAGLSLVRVANAGPGGWIDPRGRVHEGSRGREPGARLLHVDLSSRRALAAPPLLVGAFMALLLAAAVGDARRRRT